MFGFNNSFKVGSGIQVKYQVGGNSNILSNRNEGVIRKVGISKRGAYVRICIVTLRLVAIVLLPSLRRK